LAGGTGSVKLIRGLTRATREDFTIISNVGDNFWLHGLYIAPDIDTVTYALASQLDRKRGWGIKKDTFNLLHQLGKLEAETWFKMGDRDSATHLVRTELIRNGKTLADTTSELCRRLGVSQRILPASNDPLETWITTPAGTMHLQDYWVRRGGRDDVLAVTYRGAESAKPSTGVTDAILGASAVILPPANPVTSIGPILAIRGIREALRTTRSTRLAVSPIVGTAPVSGPAAKLLAGLGVPVTPLGVARMYAGLIDVFVADRSGATDEDAFRGLGMVPVFTDVMMPNAAREKALAKRILRYLRHTT